MGSCGRPRGPNRSTRRPPGRSASPRPPPCHAQGARIEQDRDRAAHQHLVNAQTPIDVTGGAQGEAAAAQDPLTVVVEGVALGDLGILRPEAGALQGAVEPAERDVGGPGRRVGELQPGAIGEAALREIDEPIAVRLGLGSMRYAPTKQKTCVLAWSSAATAVTSRWGGTA